MVLHDDIDEEFRLRKPESFDDFVSREGKREGPSSSFDSEGKDNPIARTDSFARALISAWLVAAFLTVAMLLVEPSSPLPQNHAIGPSLVQASPHSSADQTQRPAETYECTDLDYAYQWC